MQHHGAGLRRLLTAKKADATALDALLGTLTSDYREAEIEPKERAMLDYAAKLTLAPGEMHGADVEELRAVGFDDRGIHDICAIVGYYAFVNRMADGLGVELE